MSAVDTQSSPIPFTNGSAIRAGLVPCETNPNNGDLSYCNEQFHGSARATVGSQNGTMRHVCLMCLNKYHKDQRVRQGIHWE